VAACTYASMAACTYPSGTLTAKLSVDPQLARDAAAARMVDKRGAGGGGMGELLAPTARIALMIHESLGAGEISKAETSKASKVVGDLEVSCCFTWCFVMLYLSRNMHYGRSRGSDRMGADSTRTKAYRRSN